MSAVTGIFLSPYPLNSKHVQTRQFSRDHFSQRTVMPTASSSTTNNVLSSGNYPVQYSLLSICPQSEAIPSLAFQKASPPIHSDPLNSYSAAPSRHLPSGYRSSLNTKHRSRASRGVHVRDVKGIKTPESLWILGSCVSLSPAYLVFISMSCLTGWKPSGTAWVRGPPPG